MKKLTCILLAVILLLAACTPEDNVSAPETSDVSGEITEKPEYVLPSGAVDQLKTDREDAIVGEANREGSRVNHALGKEYTISSGSNTKFPDDGSITDGEFKDTHFKYVRGGWVAITGESADVTVDLGKVVEGICDFEVSTCRNTQYDVDICGAVFVSVSSDGKEWKNIGLWEASGAENDKAKFVICANIQGVVNARYVRFTFDGLADDFMLIDEICVYSHGGEIAGNLSGLNDYYGSQTVVPVDEEKYFDPSEEDYNQQQNLISGMLPLTYDGLTDVSVEFLVDSYNTLPSAGKLTDGKRATAAAMSDSRWHRNTHGTTRVVIFDLGAIAAVNGVGAGFLSYSTAGIRLPDYLSVSVSIDGETWYSVYEKAGNKNTGNSIVEFGGEFDDTYKARFIKFTFECTVHVYLDELEVFGTKNADNAVHPSEAHIEKPIVSSGYGTPDQYDGMHDVVLSYLLPDSIKVTKEQYLTYVAYLEDGEIKDTFFDGFMYLPYVSYLYSNGKKKSLTKEEWQGFVDWQFMDGYNFDALDAAVDEVKVALDLEEDYTVGTYLSLFYPVQGATNFGELNGKQMDFNNIEDRKAVLKWFVDEQIAAFNAKGYDSVRLSGFYWFVEEMSGSDPHVQEMCNYICDYVRSLGYQTTWIPYFNASGNTRWREYGFDTACLQPNYAFNEEVPLQRIYDAANMAKLFGMSIEIEINNVSDVKWVDRYRSYLYVGAEVGFMTDSVHMYYLAGMPGAIYDACVSKNPNINCIYEETYLFIKGKLTSQFKAPTCEALTCKSGEYVVGTLSIPEANVKSTDIRLAVSAANGSVTVNSDGTVVYTPYEGFTGEDWFEVVVDYGLAGQSDYGRITVTVE